MREHKMLMYVASVCGAAGLMLRNPPVSVPAFCEKSLVAEKKRTWRFYYFDLYHRPRTDIFEKKKKVSKSKTIL